jgi:hypothetical protein
VGKEKWDIDDLRGYYAAFGRRQLPDAAHYTAAVACSTLPDSHVGYDLWITWVADVPFFERELVQWAEGLGELAATLKPLIGERHRTYVESYRPEWGRQASRDGLRMAILGPNFVPGLETRATQLGCRWQAFKKIRNFVAGAATVQMQQFETQLLWATRMKWVIDAPALADMTA